MALTLAAVAAAALLTACWRPVAALLSSWLVAVGRAGTTVLATHVLLLVGLWAVAGHDLGRGWVRAVATAAVLALVLVAVRSRAVRAVVPG